MSAPKRLQIRLNGRFPLVVKGARYNLPLKSTFMYVNPLSYPRLKTWLTFFFSSGFNLVSLSISGGNSIVVLGGTESTFVVSAVVVVVVVVLVVVVLGVDACSLGIDSCSLRVGSCSLGVGSSLGVDSCVLGVDAVAFGCCGWFDEYFLYYV